MGGQFAIDPELKLWEMQPGESDTAFAAFVQYRDLGASRSVKKAADMLQKSVGTLRRWSEGNMWVYRCRAYDAHLDDVKREKVEEEVAAMAARHTQQASAMTQIVTLPVIALAQRMKDPVKRQLIMDQLDTMPVIEVLALVRSLSTAWSIATKVERIARGEPTEVIASQHSGGVSIDDRRAAVQAAFKNPKAAQLAEELHRTLEEETSDSSIH